MNIKLENKGLIDLLDNIKLLKNTKTLHPIAMSKLIRTNQNLADKKENRILNYLMS